LKTYVGEDRTGSGYTYAEKEGVEGGKERRNGGRVIGGRGEMGRSTVVDTRPSMFKARTSAPKRATKGYMTPVVKQTPRRRPGLCSGDAD